MKSIVTLATRVLLAFFLLSGNPVFAGKCSGGANCTACKNCSGCKNCSKDGGSCSVCDDSYSSKKKKKSTRATNSSDKSSSSTYTEPANNSSTGRRSTTETQETKSTDGGGDKNATYAYNTSTPSTKSDSGPSGWMYVAIIIGVMYLYDRGTRNKTRR